MLSVCGRNAAPLPRKAVFFMLPYVLAVLIGYLLGCSSMAFYMAKLKKVDIRNSGSGNLGASNAMVTMGWAAGVLTALHDIGKSVLAIYICRRLFPDAAYTDLVAGSAAVLGHIFPFYLKFKGGKGLAAYWGMILAVNWKLAIAVAAGIALITLLTDYIAIGSVSAAVFFPAYLAVKRSWIALAIVAAVSLVLICKHKTNFIRIRSGTEIGFRRANSGRDRADGKQ